MDKATLLGEVISQVKQLKKNATEASKGYLIPMETDEVKVEPYNVEERNGCMSYIATICCDFQPEILSDLRKTLDALQLQLVKAEMSTLENRMKNVFIFTCCKGDSINNVKACQSIANVVHKALGSVLEKASNSLEFSLGSSYPNKRRRMCFVEASTSCNHGSCCTC